MIAVILNGVFAFIYLRIIDSLKLKIAILEGNHKVTEDRFNYALIEIDKVQAHSDNLQKELNRVSKEINVK